MQYTVGYTASNDLSLQQLQRVQVIDIDDHLIA